MENNCFPCSFLPPICRKMELITLYLAIELAECYTEPDFLILRGGFNEVL